MLRDTVEDQALIVQTMSKVSSAMLLQRPEYCLHSILLVGMQGALGIYSSLKTALGSFAEIVIFLFDLLCAHSERGIHAMDVASSP